MALLRSAYDTIVSVSHDRPWARNSLSSIPRSTLNLVAHPSTLRSWYLISSHSFPFIGIHDISHATSPVSRWRCCHQSYSSLYIPLSTYFNVFSVTLSCWVIQIPHSANSVLSSSKVIHNVFVISEILR